MTQQIGYSLIHGSYYDYGRVVLSFIGERINDHRNTVYYARICQLISNVCFHDIPIPSNEIVLVFKLTKKAFYDLISQDENRLNLAHLRLPLVTTILLLARLPETYGLLNSQSAKLQEITIGNPPVVTASTQGQELMSPNITNHIYKLRNYYYYTNTTPKPRSDPGSSMI